MSPSVAAGAGAAVGFVAGAAVDSYMNDEDDQDDDDGD